MAGMADVLIVMGVVAVPVIAYATNFAGFRTWIETAAAAGGAGSGAAETPNRCWPVGDGRCACSCHGGKYNILGKAGGCDDCAAFCSTGKLPSPPLGKQKCAPSSGMVPNAVTAASIAATRSSLGLTSFATYPIKGIIVS